MPEQGRSPAFFNNLECLPTSSRHWRALRDPDSTPPPGDPSADSPTPLSSHYPQKVSRCLPFKTRFVFWFLFCFVFTAENFQKTEFQFCTCLWHPLPNRPYFLGLVEGTQVATRTSVQAAAPEDPLKPTCRPSCDRGNRNHTRLPFNEKSVYSTVPPVPISSRLSENSKPRF